ncbi:MAG: prepilin peptidase, partial [Candidatus Paceibacterales bacterium]
RYCKKPISFQYPLVELATGFLFLFIFQSTNLWLHDSIILSFLNLCLLSLVSCLLIIIFVYDLKHYIIPDRVIYPAIVIAFLYQLFRILNLGFVSDLGFRISDFMILLNPLLSAILALSFFLSIVLISRGRWMGVGDIKLAFFMGLFLGFPNILVALFSAFFIGAIIGLILIAAGLKTLKSEIPFGPFLITGTFLALFWGERLINFYQNLFFF